MNSCDAPINAPGLNGRGQIAPPPSRNSGAAATRRVVDRAIETEPGLIGAQARSLCARLCCKSFGASVAIGFIELILNFVYDPRLFVQ